MQEDPGLVSVCVTSPAPGSLLLYFSSIWHTHTCNRWSRRPPPPHPRPHTLREPAIPAHLLAGWLNACCWENYWSSQYPFAISQLETGASVEWWRTFGSGSRSVGVYRFRVPPYLQLLITAAGNNLQISDKGGSVGVWAEGGKESEMRASGQAGEDPRRVDKHVNT